MTTLNEGPTGRRFLTAPGLKFSANDFAYLIAVCNPLVPQTGIYAHQTAFYYFIWESIFFAH